MAESSLSLTFSDLYSEVSDLLGTGLEPAGDDLIRAKKRVNDGYRMFLMGSMPGQPPRIWSFLRKTATLAMTANTYNLALPDNFAVMLSDPRYDQGQGIAGSLLGRDAASVMSMREGSNGVCGLPQFYAIRSKAAASASVSSRFEMIFFPTPTTAWNMIMEYQFVPSKLVNDTDVPLGAQIHSNTILEACLAAAEQKGDDTQGIHTKNFLLAMAQSIAIDEQTAAKTLGYVRGGGEDIPVNGGDRRTLYYNDTLIS